MMIEKMITAASEQQSQFLRTQQIVKRYRHKVEIELGGPLARRDKEHAEDLRCVINDCHDSERYLNAQIAILTSAIQELEGMNAPEAEQFEPMEVPPFPSIFKQ